MDNKGKKILIVEDDQFLREFYVELLSGEGYAIDAAADGELDIMLPKRDGVQILESLKTNPPIHSNGPIVMLTNIGQDSTIKTCFTYGATGYMIKSALEPSQVLSEVQNYLKPMTPKA
jgi:CheY-like chemotaxis protein